MTTDDVLVRHPPSLLAALRRLDPATANDRVAFPNADGTLVLMLRLIEGEGDDDDDDAAKRLGAHLCIVRGVDDAVTEALDAAMAADVRGSWRDVDDDAEPWIVQPMIEVGADAAPDDPDLADAVAAVNRLHRTRLCACGRQLIVPATTAAAEVAVAVDECMLCVLTAAPGTPTGPCMVCHETAGAVKPMGCCGQLVHALCLRRCRRRACPNCRRDRDRDEPAGSN